MAKEKNVLTPVHRKLEKSEITSLFKKYLIEDVLKLPKIKIKDQALAELDVEVGDVIEITRKSFAGKSKYYRVIIE